MHSSHHSEITTLTRYLEAVPTRKIRQNDGEYLVKQCLNCSAEPSKSPESPGPTAYARDTRPVAFLPPGPLASPLLPSPAAKRFHCIRTVGICHVVDSHLIGKVNWPAGLMEFFSKRGNSGLRSLLVSPTLHAHRIVTAWTKTGCHCLRHHYAR